MLNESTIESILSPEEAAQCQADLEDVEWFRAHAREISNSCKGKYVVVVNKELFVGDTPEEVWAKAQAKYPHRGPDIRFIHPNPPKVRFYDCTRELCANP